jgi:protein-tyrosine phosphatase
MRIYPFSKTRLFSALGVLALIATIAFAPYDGVSADRPTVVETSMGPIPLPGNAAMPSVTNSEGPIEVEGLDIKNFGVLDGSIFRGEQPAAPDYPALARLGVKTIIDLRLDSRKSSRELAEAAGLRYVNIPIDDHKQPTDEHVAAFMKTIADPETGCSYVHCAGGRHRTGSMIAIYRMVHDGWTVDQAYEEMLKYDFYTANGHKGFKTFVFDYYNRMKADPASVPAAYAPPAIVEPMTEPPASANP